MAALRATPRPHRLRPPGGAYLGAVTPLGISGLYLALLLETGVPAAVTYYRFRSEKWKLVSRAYQSAAAGHA